MKSIILAIKEFFESLSWCDFGIHDTGSISHVTGAGYTIGYCKKCGKMIIL